MRIPDDDGPERERADNGRAEPSTSAASHRFNDALALARAAHPDIDLPPESFRAYLDERVPEGADAARHAADLYLCCACLARIPRALTTFDALFVPSVNAALVPMGLHRTARDDVMQQVREKLLVPAPGSRARLADYAARGSLAAWLRSVTVRTALDAQRRERGTAARQTDEDEWLIWPAPGQDPELAEIKRTCGPVFKEAFSQAVSALDIETRLLLRQHLPGNRILTPKTVTAWFLRVDRGAAGGSPAPVATATAR